MRKPLLWLTLLLAGALVWLLLRQRRDEFAEMATQLAPPEPTPPRRISEAELSELFGDLAEPASRESFGATSEDPAAASEDPLARETVLPAPPTAVTEQDLAAARETVEPAPPSNAELVAVEPAGAAPAEDAPPAEGADDDAQDLGDADALDGVTGYCMRCRAKREMVDPQEEITDSGRRAARGTCPVCGTNMLRFLKSEE